MLRIIAIFMLILFVHQAVAQTNVFNTKRKKVEVPNYTLFLHLHDIALEYSSRIDFEVDSLFKANNVNYHQNIFDFRIRTIQSIQHVLYKSDPVIGFLDSWVFAVQMVNYLNTYQAEQYLSFAHTDMQVVFNDFVEEFTDTYSFLSGDPTEISRRIHEFAEQYPIVDEHLGRTSIVGGTAQWVGQASIGFKSGVSTLTDAMRNMSDRLNYLAEFTPKIVEWNVERSVGSLVGTDSLGPVLESSIHSLERLTHAVDSIDYLVYSITDTVLTDIDRQRWETLNFMASERKVVIDQFIEERKELINQLIQQRLAFESLIQNERQASIEQFEGMIRETTVYSFDRIESLTNQIFWKTLLLVTIGAVALVIAVVVFKKM